MHTDIHNYFKIFMCKFLQALTHTFGTYFEHLFAILFIPLLETAKRTVSFQNITSNVQLSYKVDIKNFYVKQTHIHFPYVALVSLSHDFSYTLINIQISSGI